MRFADGVEFDGESDGMATFTVSIPADEDGHVGRDCPECEQHFRIEVDAYDALPDDIRLHCVYCGHNDDHSEFMTEQQMTRAMRVVEDYAIQLVGRELDRAFRGIERRTRTGALQVRYRSKPYFPRPLPGIDEERLIRERRCARCALPYAVFGEHRFCPACGQLPLGVVASDALEAEEMRLDVLHDLDDEALAAAREAGVLDATCADVVKKVVSIVETAAERFFIENVPDAADVLRGKGKVFQRLEDAADLLEEHVGGDLRGALGDRWQDALRLWALRHLHVHRDGVVDQRYLKAVPNSDLQVGQRVRINESDARHAIGLARSLVQVLEPREER